MGRGYGSDVDYDERDGSSAHSRTTGMSIGWQRMINEESSAKESKLYLGLMVGRGINVQRYEISDVENDSEAMVGGVYGLYIHTPVENRSWYGSCSLLHGRLTFDNTVPGEHGYGLDQEYDGKISILTVDGGISFRQENGWSVEPQL